MESSGAGIGSTREELNWVVSGQRVRLSHGVLLSMHEALESIPGNTEQKQKPQSQTKPDNHLLGRQLLKACWNHLVFATIPCLITNLIGQLYGFIYCSPFNV